MKLKGARRLNFALIHSLFPLSFRPPFDMFFVWRFNAIGPLDLLNGVGSGVVRRIHLDRANVAPGEGTGMQVKLKVMQGVQSGREVAVPKGRFLIGRGEECHLRPRSEAISRQHCEIRVSDNQVLVRDLGSKNGVHVNGDRLAEDCMIKTGDKLQVGPLLFEFVVDLMVPGAKRPAARDVKEVAARTAATESDDMDVTQWLEDDDDSQIAREVATPETRQFRLDEVLEAGGETTISDDTKVGEDSKENEEAAAEDAAAAGNEKGGRWKKEKEKPGKLPPPPQTSSKDSREAASDMLKRFFNRR